MRDTHMDDIGDVCSAAMDLVTFLDTETLASLGSKMGDRIHSREETVDLVIEAINTCQMVVNPHFATISDSGEPLRKSDADFRRALRNSTAFSRSQLEALVASVDKHETNKVKFGDLMTFFVAAGRRVAAAENASPISNSPHRVESYIHYDASELMVTSSYVSVVAVPEHNSFLAATLRWVDIVDETMRVLPATRRMAPPQGDPTATIASVEYALPLDEVLVGLNNLKIMTFNYVDGRKQREVTIGSIPITLRCIPVSLTRARSTSPSHHVVVEPSEVQLVDRSHSSPTSRNRSSSPSRGVESGGIDVTVLCGTDSGTMVTLSLKEHCAIRVSTSAKLAATKISSIIPFFELGFVVCVSGKCLLVCEASTGVLARPPYVASGVITAAAKHDPTTSLVFAVTSTSSSVFQFQRRNLKSSRLENPVEIARQTTTVSLDPIVLLTADAYCPDNMISITANGVLSLWDVQHRASASLSPDQGAEVQLRLPPTAKNFSFAATLASRKGIIIGGKVFICAVTRSTQSLLLVEHEGDLDDEKTSASTLETSQHVGTHFDHIVCAIPMAPKHSAFAHPTHCIANVFPHGVQIFDVSTGKSVAELTFGSSPLAAAKGKNRKKPPLRIRSATLGPGQVLLLGSDSGSLHSFSLEASSLGDCDLILPHPICSGGEVTSIFYSSVNSTVGFCSFDGTLTTAALSEDCTKLSSLITATAINRCDALAHDDEHNILAVADLQEQTLRIFSIVGTGTRLKPLCKISLFGTMCMSTTTLATAQHSSSSPHFMKSPLKSTSAASQSHNKIVRMVVQPMKTTNLTKQLFQDEANIASLVLTTSIQGLTEAGSTFTLFSLRRDDDDAVTNDQSFLTNLQKKRGDSHLLQHHLHVETDGIISKNCITALSVSIDENFLFGLSDGSVSMLHVASKSLRPSTSHVQLVGSGGPVEAVSSLCPVVGLHNVSVCRGSEKPSLLFRHQRVGGVRDRSPAVEGLLTSPNPMSPSRNPETTPTSSVRKTRSAKPDRPSPLLPGLKARSGSAGATPKRSVNSILEVVSSSRSSSKRRAGQLHLPPLGRR